MTSNEELRFIGAFSLDSCCASVHTLLMESHLLQVRSSALWELQLPSSSLVSPCTHRPSYAESGTACLQKCDACMS